MVEEGENEVSPAPALIDVHPSQSSVAVAVGSDLRVYDLHGDCPVSLVDDNPKAFHSDSIRALRYGANGKLLVSAGDDKLVKIWSSQSWRCIATVSSEKRVSAIAVSNDGLHVCFADKFGVIWVVGLEDGNGNQTSVEKKPAPMLAHYCSIITSLEFSPDGCFIVSADRDSKIRVSVVPKRPLDGSHEIQSFCLGHSDYVSCIDFVPSQDRPEGFLVSGSGDSTVRLWDIVSGSLLDTFEVGTKAGCLECNGSESNSSAVTHLCVVPNGKLIAVAIQSLQGIMLLACDPSAKSLSFTKVISIEGETFIPTCLRTSLSERLLWIVTGISKLNGSEPSSLVRVKTMHGFSQTCQGSDNVEPILLGDEEIPGGHKLLEKLQGSVSLEENVFVAAAEALKKSMCNLLVKKQYSDERREFRKRTRNDKKLKQ